MTSEPLRPRERGPGAADLRREAPAAGDGRAWPSAHGAPGPDQPGDVPVLQAERDAEVALATFGYLGAVFTGPVIPLGIYLIGRRVSPFTRYHAATALNLSLTWLLYAVCCLILGGVLLLDSLTTALVVALPIATWLWVCTAGFLIRGIAAANRGEPNAAPAWICARIAR
jgi:uncharacterized Tic20 family protein